jgi:hypothetical protein
MERELMTNEARFADQRLSTVFGVPVPRGVRKDWTARNRSNHGESFTLLGYGLPREWGKPSNVVAWYDRFGRCRLIVSHFGNGRAATIRIDANGNRKLTYGDVPTTGRNHYD